jgi:hypothetical protein
MGLDAPVRCRCIQDGRAKPHPFPGRLILDETAEPLLSDDSSDEAWEVHDRWFAESCEHEGYLCVERLGNISLIAHVRDFLRCLEDEPGPRFPVLLKHVVYDGTHSGDWIAATTAVELLKEVDTVLHSSDILAASEKEFFGSMKRLCEASMASGNPIVF